LTRVKSDAVRLSLECQSAREVADVAGRFADGQFSAKFIQNVMELDNPIKKTLKNMQSAN